MEKIVLLGDFQNKKTHEYLLKIVEKYSDDFKVFVSGANLNKISIKEKISIVQRNTSEYIDCIFTSSIVILLDNSTNFTKYKTNQRVISFHAVPLEIDVNNHSSFKEQYSYLLHTTDCVTFKSEKQDNKVVFETNFYNYIESFDDSNVDEVLDNLQIKKAFTNLEKDILVVTNNLVFLKNSQYNFHNFVNTVSKKYDSYNLIVLNFNENIKISNANFVNGCSYCVDIFNSAIMNKYIENFTGILVFDDLNTKNNYNDFLKQNHINNKAESSVLVSDLNLFFGEDDLVTYLENINVNNGDIVVEYKNKLEKMYSEDICNQKISIVICNYNTPNELLYRAVLSALNSSHNNIEVIVVDDGSRERIEADICSHFADYGDKFKYYYKENEGLGLSRNFGVKKSTGDYIFFLDSDDTIEVDGLKHMLIHQRLFNLDVVIGKRVICNEEEEYFNESLRHLYGKTYICYFNHIESGIYDDQMPNNKLLKRDSFEKYDLWFEKGMYEDALFTAKIFSRVPEYHCVNVHIHNWYKYKSERTISSSKDYNNFTHKLNALEMAWDVLPDFVKSQRLAFHFVSDFANYYGAVANYSDKEKLDLFTNLYNFFNQRKDFYVEYRFGIVGKLIINSLKNNNYDDFIRICTDYYKSVVVSDETYDNYVVHTHYHLYASVVYAYQNKRPARIFVSQGYSNFSNELISRLREINVFAEVTVFSNDNVVSKLLAELDECPSEAKTIIPNYLYLKYAPSFQKCNPLDNVYIFSDSLPYWYFVERYFENIYKIEDAYDSIKRELEIFNVEGIWGGIQKFIPEHYPPMNCKSEKIKKIFISKPIDGIDELCLSKCVVKDIKSMVKDSYSELSDIFNHLYSIPTALNESSILLLTQPLALSGYCTLRQQVILYSLMLKSYSKSDIFIKPHPADNFNYQSLGYNVLPRDIPVEVYNFNSVKIKKALTFGSSSVNLIEFAEEREHIFPLSGFTIDDVKNEIKRIIRSNKAYLVRRKIELAFRLGLIQNLKIVVKKALNKLK